MFKLADDRIPSVLTNLLYRLRYPTNEAADFLRTHPDSVVHVLYEWRAGKRPSLLLNDYLFDETTS